MRKRPDVVAALEEAVHAGDPSEQLRSLYAHYLKEGYPIGDMLDDDSFLAAIAADMEVVGFFGGGHATAAWYRDQLLEVAPELPCVDTEDELFEYLDQR